jgi:GT2 family glycosyltransferase
MAQIDLSIIIVSYNTRDFLAECLESIQKNASDELSYEVIVVDNSSTDDSVAFLKQHFPDVQLIASPENLGFSKANNLGVAKSKGRYVLFLNPDTVIYKGTLEHMVKFMDVTKDAGAATCYLEMSNGKLDDATHRGFPTPWNSFSHFSGLSKIFPNTKVFGGYNLGWQDLKKTHDIDALAGAFMLVRREAGDEVGWWDERYFFYGEDLDFCYQLKKKGWKIYFVPDVKILHYKGVSGGIKKHSQHLSTATSETKVRSTLARFEAMKIFYKKNYMKRYPGFVTWLVFRGIDLKMWLTLQSI